MVGQASVPTNQNDSNLNDSIPVLLHGEDNNGNTKEIIIDQDHIHENEEDVCSCSFSEDTPFKIMPSSLNNNGNSTKTGKNSISSKSTSPYIISLSSSRTHSNHHVLS